MTPLVLCYHAVSPTWEHRLSIHPDLLLRQVRALSGLRRVRVSFDDAFRSASTVIPQIQARDIPVLIFVCSGFAVDGAPLTVPELESDDPTDLAELVTMNWDELRDLAERGVEIGSHCVSHPHLLRLSDGELRRELVDSKDEIESAIGRPCTELSYPYGEQDARVRSAVQAAGYARAFALRGSNAEPYAARRIDLYRRHTVARALLRSL